ncbi:hypothetical protein STENM223S_09556 [Streptomyces tendae]
MVVVLALIVLLLMTYDAREAPAAGPRPEGGDAGKGGDGSPVSSPPAPTTP